MLTDLVVHDWWSLVLAFARDGAEDGAVQRQVKWVGELMAEEKVRALPRSMEQLGRCYDSRDFWAAFGLMPARSSI